MAVSFTVSVPGKVILNGEHSVVYNKPALAGVIGLRNSLTLTETNDDFLSINFDIFSNVKIIYLLTSLNQILDSLSVKFNASDIRTELESRHDEYLSIIEGFVQQDPQLVDLDLDQQQRQIIEKASTAIVYLFTALELSHAKSNGTIPRINKGIRLDFKSEIPTGAGLGSSASFAVCIASAFYVYTSTHSRTVDTNDILKGLTPDEVKSFYETISSWAFLSERIMHGTPSGLDNTICTYGNVVKFTKNPKKFEDIVLKSKLNVMLVDTGVSRNTLQIVQNVRSLRDDHPQMIDQIMDAMGSLVNDVVQIIDEKNESEATEDENYEKLKRLFTVNNNLLRTLGVSHPKLEEIFSISERYGFASKLTGAGAGGFAVILLPPSYANDDAFHKLAADLSHFSTNVTTIGGDGLRVQDTNDI